MSCTHTIGITTAHCDATVQPRSSAPSRSRYPARSVLATVLMALCLNVTLDPNGADARRKPIQRVEPDLRIISVTASPEPYEPGSGPLTLVIEVALPQDLAGSTLLEVSSLISSPSKSSMRFLSVRQTIEAAHPAANPGSGASGAPASSRVSVSLTWDGTDQTKQPVGQGRYAYEVRAKLLAIGAKGPRTQMVSWPKRGTVNVQ